MGVLDSAPNGDVRFTYDADIIAEKRAENAVGFKCPVRATPYTGQIAESVFENLLPEGVLRSTLGQATKHDPSDTIGLLGAVGGECAGALQLWPEGTTPSAVHEYELVSKETLTTAFNNASFMTRQVTGRSVLSGVQPKLAMLRRPAVGGTNPTYKLPRNGAPTTIVVKQASLHFPHLLEAEMLGMRLMEKCGVPTASSAECLVASGCHESARFDREEMPDGRVKRLHAEDGCQISGRMSRNKYANENAPTFLELCAVLKRLSTNPLEDRETLFRWAMVNAAIGNYDAHAKNVSVVYLAGDRARLAPAYDVVITAAYEGIDKNFALHFCGTTHPHAMRKEGLAVASREFELSLARIKEITEDVFTRVRNGLSDALGDIVRLRGESDFLSQLERSVLSTSRELENRVVNG